MKAGPWPLFRGASGNANAANAFYHFYFISLCCRVAQ